MLELPPEECPVETASSHDGIAGQVCTTLVQVREKLDRTLVVLGPSLARALREHVEQRIVAEIFEKDDPGVEVRGKDSRHGEAPLLE
jgi:hypothetical protein